MPERELSPEITQRFLQAMRWVIANQAKDVTNKTEFASMVGEYQQNFSKMEQGLRYPTIESIALLCKEFGIDANWIMLDEGNMLREESQADAVIRSLQRIEKDLKDLKKAPKSKLARKPVQR